MKIFISHSSGDNELAKRVVNQLNSSQIESYWIDFDIFKDASKIRSEINKGLKNSDTFILLWSKNAQPSSYVEDEIDAVCSPPYDKKIQKIIFKLDDTDLRPLDNILKYRHVDPSEIETHVKDVVETYSKSFEERYKIFREKVQEDYKNIPEYPDSPIISNFKKLENGAKNFVKQRFKNRHTHKTGEDVFDFTTKQIKIKLEELQRKNSFETSLPEIQKQIEDYQKTIDSLSKDGISFKPEDSWKLEKSIYKHEKIPDDFIEILADIKNLKRELRNFKKSKERIVESGKKIKEIQIIRDKIDKLKEEEKMLSSVDLNRSSIEDLESRKIRLDEIPKEISEFESELGYRLEEESLAKQIIRDESTKTKTEEEIKAEISKLEQKLQSVDKSIKITHESARHILTIIRKYQILKKQFSEIQSEILDLSKEKLIPITGDYGSGKSALCNHIINFLCQLPQNELIVFFIPLGSLPKNDEQTTNLKNDILNFINKEYDFYLSNENYQKLIDSGKVVFMLDALDELSDKLDSTIGQKNLERVIKLAKNSVVLLTSRDNYMSETMDEKLFEYDNVLKIEDFDIKEITKFLNFRNKNKTFVNEVLSLIKNNSNIGKLACKPLFLNVINENFSEINKYRIINESVIFTILTDRWLVHDSKIREETNLEHKEELKKSREEISEILSFAKKGVDESISIDDIRDEVKMLTGQDGPDGDDKIEEYYKDAISSTFLVKEQGNTFRFVINPVREYFRARRIVSAISNGDTDLLLSLTNMISSKETFDFIKGLLDIKWSIKPHIARKICEITDDNTLKDLVADFEENHFVLLDVIKKVQSNQSQENISNVLRILNISGKLPPRTNLSCLNFENAELLNINLLGCNLSNSNFSNANLKGANLSECNLTQTIFQSANLSNVNFHDSILQNVNFTNTILISSYFRDEEFHDCILTQSKLNFSNLNNVYFKNCKLKNVDFSGTNLENVDFKEMNLSECKFLQTKLLETKICDVVLRSCDFRGTNLTNVDFSRSDLYRAKFQGSNLTKTIFNRSDLSRSNLSGSDLTNTDIHRTIMTSIIGLPISEEDAVSRGAIF